MSKYKASNGGYLTQGLFYEFNNREAEYTLRDTDQEEYYVSNSGNKYRSFPYLYRQFDSEYEFAITVLGSYAHWKRLCDCEWFKTGVASGTSYSGLNDWREERKERENAKAHALVMKQIQEGNLQAAKVVLDNNKKTASKGRPEKKIPTPKASNVSSIYKKIKQRNVGGTET